MRLAERHGGLQPRAPDPKPLGTRVSERASGADLQCFERGSPVRRRRAQRGSEGQGRSRRLNWGDERILRARTRLVAVASVDFFALRHPPTFYLSYDDMDLNYNAVALPTLCKTYAVVSPSVIQRLCRPLGQHLLSESAVDRGEANPGDPPRGRHRDFRGVGRAPETTGMSTTSLLFSGYCMQNKYNYKLNLFIMSAPVINSLFITLKRSTAGVRHQHVRIVEALGLRHREHTVERANTAAMRGALAKVGSWERGGRGVARWEPGWGGAESCELARARTDALPVPTSVQIPHLVLVETNLQRAARLAAEAEAKRPLPPVRVQHAAA